jgi:hypothetical protein
VQIFRVVEHKSASARSCDDYEVRRRGRIRVCWATHNPYKACPRSCERNLARYSRCCDLLFLEDMLPEVLESPTAQKGGWVRPTFPIPATQKRAGGADAKLTVARPETRQGPIVNSLAKARHLEREGSVQPPSFTIPWQRILGEHHGRYHFCFSTTTLAFIPFLRS